jgi:hypothetical protein
MSWTRRRKMWALVLAGIATASVVTPLVLLQVPISEEQSGYTMIGFQLYTFEAVNIYQSPWAHFTERGVEFEFPPPDCPLNTGGGNVCGSVLQPNGVSFAFDIELPPPCHGIGSWLTWVSPNQREAIEVGVCASSQTTHILVAA